MSDDQRANEPKAGKPGASRKHGGSGGYGQRPWERPSELQVDE